MLSENKDYPIGTKFYTAGKNKIICTVVDILKTYNSKGELVKTIYLEEHPFAGQIIRSEVVKASISLRLIK